MPQPLLDRHAVQLRAGEPELVYQLESSWKTRTTWSCRGLEPIHQDSHDGLRLPKRGRRVPDSGLSTPHGNRIRWVVALLLNPPWMNGEQRRISERFGDEALSDRGP